MSRLLLLLTVVLGALLVGARAVRSDPDQPPPVAGVAEPVPVGELAAQARLDAARRREEALGWLEGAAGVTYLDSLLLTSDSVVRRWPDRLGRPITVAVIEPPAGTPGAVLRTLVGSVLVDWDRSEVAVRLALAADSGSADIIVTWVDHFPQAGDSGPRPGLPVQSGLTTVVTNARGEIQRARVQLALTDGTGRPLGETEIRSVTIHELGHALGLPHSNDPGDIMFPTVRVAAPSARDRASQVLLYRLPTGSIRAPAAPRPQA